MKNLKKLVDSKKVQKLNDKQLSQVSGGNNYDGAIVIVDVATTRDSVR